MKTNFKLCLYLLALLALQIQTSMADYTADDIATWKKWDWIKLGITVAGSLGLSLRMFLDQSVARDEAAKNSGIINTPHPTP